MTKYTSNSRLDGTKGTTVSNNGEKWWFSFVLGMVFGIMSSSPVYEGTSYITTAIGGMPTMEGRGPTIGGILVHSLLFALVVRVILA